ncbi:MAG: amidophosphoribosyltransferase, partial [Eubacteriales bacterium]|nr:amidophosphoribosyltransferase [Eubacteriales bacterium]
NRKELIAAQKRIEEIRQYTGADSLNYLSLDGLLGVFGDRRDDFCTACFDGEYPVKMPGKTNGKFALEG